MSPIYILIIIAIYFLALYVISIYTSKNATNATFFTGNRKSPWYLVAFGMIGASLSGVTFISVPGSVGSSHFSYLQMVLGYFVGYFVIGAILMPIYYKLQLTSIYGYLEQRFGKYSYKTGASFFLLSRTFGAAIRLFLSATVLQVVLFNHLNIPFPITVVIIILFIYLFTYRGGVRTVIFTDTIQTAFMLASLAGCVYILSSRLNMDFGTMISTVYNSDYAKTFFWDDWHDKKFFFKQFIGGAFIAIAMTGLDQDLMQKNLSCRNLKDAQKNMFWFTITLLPVNLLFLSLGAMLYLFSAKTGFPLPALSDELFPTIATQPFMPAIFSTIFILGLISSTYSSADSALTSLTTSITIDILGAHKKNENILTKTRKITHIFMAIVLVVLILIFKQINNQSVISAVFIAAGYTYGPLLGIFAFGIFTKWKLRDVLVPVIAIASPLFCLLINYALSWSIGFEILILNGIITFVGLWCIRVKN
jgi:SSS family solute:Na+ symporter